MTEVVRPEINCPSCDSAIEGTEGQAVITCSVCNGQFALAGHLCPACSMYHEEDQAACAECGNPLVRLCSHCQTINWTGDVECVECGQPIDLLGQVVEANQSDAERLDRQMNQAAALKETEAAASNKRMAELMAIEEARQAELLQQRIKRQRQERKMLIIVFAAVMLFLLGMIGYSLLSSG